MVGYIVLLKGKKARYPGISEAESSRRYKPSKCTSAPVKARDMISSHKMMGGRRQQFQESSSEAQMKHINQVQSSKI